MDPSPFSSVYLMRLDKEELTGALQSKPNTKKWLTLTKSEHERAKKNYSSSWYSSTEEHWHKATTEDHLLWNRPHLLRARKSSRDVNIKATCDPQWKLHCQQCLFIHPGIVDTLFIVASIMLVLRAQCNRKQLVKFLGTRNRWMSEFQRISRVMCWSTGFQKNPGFPGDSLLGIDLSSLP